MTVASRQAPAGIFLIKEKETGGHEDEVEHALGGTLALGGSFYAESGDEPVEREDEPGSDDDF
jgi:hypothetical protein